MTNSEAIHKLIGYRRFIEKMAMTIPGFIFDAEPFDLAISALEKQEQDRWIPVTERLPEVRQRVLAQRKDGFMEVKVCIDGGHLAWFYSGILAWQPLPEPYTEDES